MHACVLCVPVCFGKARRQSNSFAKVGDIFRIRRSSRREVRADGQGEEAEGSVSPDWRDDARGSRKILGTVLESSSILRMLAHF